MRSSLMHRWRLLLAILPVVGSTGTACAQIMPPPFDFSQIDQEVYEFVGQVKNSPPAGPGLPATSIQYGYISHVRGLSDDQLYLAGVPQNEASALLTFYNDSVTEKGHQSRKLKNCHSRRYCDDLLQSGAQRPLLISGLPG